jgi:hypothetical protein
MNPQLALEDFAKVRARLDADHEMPAVLADHGLTAAEWDQAQERWLARLSDALDCGEMELLRAYDTAYQAALERLGVAPRPIAAQQPRDAPGVESSLPGRNETAAISFDDIQRAILPYVSGQSPSAPSPAPLEEHPAIGETGFLSAVSFDDPLPFGETVQEPRREPGSRGGPSVSDETAFLPALALEEPLPFARATSARPPPSLQATEPVSRRPIDSGTAELRVDAAASMVLPFRPVSPRGSSRVGPLTLQQAAALEVEVAQGIGRVAEVLGRFNLDQNAYHTVRTVLARLRAADPELARHYQAEREAYSAWRSKHRR